MSKILNGREATAIVAQLLNERVYAYDNAPQTQPIQQNIWNQPVKWIEKNHDPLSHVFSSIGDRELTTAFLSSSSLLSTIPYLYKLAQDNASIVLHVADDHQQYDDSFSDFSEVMSIRQSGLALLSSSSVQEAHDLSLLAQYVSLVTSTPFLHFFDSKRISDESTSIDLLEKETLLNVLAEGIVLANFKNKSGPDSSSLKQSAYLQYKASLGEEQETAVEFYQEAAIQLSEITGRSYAPMEYVGHPDAEYVIVSMGAGASVIEQTLQVLPKDAKVGALKIRLYRPWSDSVFLNTLPSTVQRIAVLEPTYDYTSTWNPLFLDVAATLQTAGRDDIDIVSGQYGVQETDFSPSSVAAVFQGLADNKLDRSFQVSALPGSLVRDVHQNDLQVIFTGDAGAFVSRQQEQVQVYQVNGLTHVRVAREGPFLPSLIQAADVVVVGADEGRAIEALKLLKQGGLVVFGQDLDTLSSGVKKVAHTQQARVAVVKDLVSFSDIVGSPVPESWSTEQLVPLTVKPVVAKPVVQETSVETPYIKMLDQVFGARLDIVNAYRDQSIWGAASTPEFGYGRLVNLIQERERFVQHVVEVIQAAELPKDTLKVLSQWVLRVNSPDRQVKKIHQAADLVVQVLTSSGGASSILDKKDLLYASSNWLIGSDSWATDLGDSGLHHVITSGDNVNILIVDTTPYSSEVERDKRKKDIGLYAMNYGSVYVASVALYASYTGVLQALMEADAYQGPSIVLAYLPQVPGHLQDPLATLKETKVSVDNGSWPLYRWNPQLEEQGEEMFKLDSQRIKKELEEFLARENHLTQLVSAHLDIRSSLLSSLESDVKKRHHELKSKARADYARLLSGLGTINGPPLLVLFGSDNGNAEGVAKKIASRGQRQGLRVQWMAMDDYSDIQDLANETNVMIICSTAGQGEIPSNGREFWKALNGLNSGDVDFSQLNFAVFGLGDSHYWPREEDAIFYNRPGKLMDAKLDTLGATRLVPLGLGDDQDEDGFETGLSAWQPEFWKSLGVKDLDEEEPVYTDNQMKLDSNFLRGHIAEEIADHSTGNVTELTGKLMKFHGTYVQDDRDLREERKKQGLDKAYSFLIRVRTPGGVSTSEQWLAMDALSEKYGNKTMKLTTRQAYQLHGVLKKNLRTTIRGINKALFSTIAACGDVNRNIMSTAVTEIPEIHGQVQSLVDDLKDLLEPHTNAYHEIWLDDKMVAGHAVQDSEPLYGPSYLPRKFKIVVAVPPNNDVDVYAHDLGLIAIVDRDNKKVTGYNVLIGGGMGQTHGNKKTYPRPASLIGYVPADRMVQVAEAVVSTQRDHGDRLNRKHARFKYTIDDLGLDFIKKDIESRMGFAFEEPKPFEFKDNVDQYGWTKGLGDTWNFTMFIENGRVKDTPEFLCKTGLRELAKFHKGQFRLTANQHLVVANVPEQDLEKTKAHLAKYKMDNIPFSGIRKTAMACVALPTCGLAMAESERYLPHLITLFEKVMEDAGLRDDTIVTRMTGCPNGCSRPYLAELAFVGKAPKTYNIYLGGSRKGERLNKLYKENMQEEDILREITPMIKRYALERSDDEPFGDWVIRAGYVKRTITGTDFHDL